MWTIRPDKIFFPMRSWIGALFVSLAAFITMVETSSASGSSYFKESKTSLRPAFALSALPSALTRDFTNTRPKTCNARISFGSGALAHRTRNTALQAKKAKGQAKKDRQQEGGGTQRKESQVVADVLVAAKEAGTGFESDPQAVEKLVCLLEELEEKNAIENPARSGNLWGKWRLLFTNSPPMLKNKGVTGLGSLPFVGFEELTQEFQSDGTAETVEILKMPPFGTPARSTLKGTVTAVSLEVIEQTYVDVQLASVFKSKADSVGSDNYFSKAVLAITYLSDSLRVCRSPSGALFLFERVQFSR